MSALLINSTKQRLMSYISCFLQKATQKLHKCKVCMTTQDKTHLLQYRHVDVRPKTTRIPFLCSPLDHWCYSRITCHENEWAAPNRVTKSLICLFCTKLWCKDAAGVPCASFLFSTLPDICLFIFTVCPFSVSGSVRYGCDGSLHSQWGQWIALVPNLQFLFDPHTFFYLTNSCLTLTRICCHSNSL